MSLTGWVEWDRELIDLLFDKPSFSGKGFLDIKAQPLTTNYGTVGTAFNYAITFEIAKQNINMLGEQRINFPITARLGIKLHKRRTDFICKFDNKLTKFFNGSIPITNLLSDCITLAKMETVYRCGRDFPDSEVFYTNDLDLQDLRQLMNITNIEQWKSIKSCIINPIFRKSSLAIGGADADVIIDGRIIDIKTTKHLKFEKEYFRQLVGYYILNKREHNLYGNIKTLGIYFSRFGMLYEFPVPKMNNITVGGKPTDKWKVIEESINEYRKDML
jgi:hypothetical protein